MNAGGGEREAGREVGRRTILWRIKIPLPIINKSAITIKPTHPDTLPVHRLMF